MNLEALKDMYAHMDWADSMVWRATLETPAGAADDQIQDTLLHMHSAQSAFLDVWRHRAPSLRDRESFEDAADLMRWARAYYPLAHAFLLALSPEAMGAAVTIPWVRFMEAELGRRADPVTLGETLYQVVAHSMHHRGQVNRRIREIGGEPPLVDYLVWLWLGRPDPVWVT